MASKSTVFVAVLLAVCTLFLAVSSAPSLRPVGHSRTTHNPDRKLAKGGYCFREISAGRNGTNRRSRCHDKIEPVINGTALNITECCSLEGKGWSRRDTGKRCFSACEEEEASREEGEAEGEEETVQAAEEEASRKEARREEEKEEEEEEEEVEAEGADEEEREGKAARTTTSAALLIENGEEEMTAMIREIESKAVSQKQVDGGWSEWSQWQPCSQICRVGLTFTRRFRDCNNPRPAYGGANCPGDYIDGRECSECA